MFSRNGYWVRKNINGEIVSLIKIENGGQEYAYRKGEWVATGKFTSDIGMSDEWDKIEEKDLDNILKQINW